MAAWRLTLLLACEAMIAVLALALPQALSLPTFSPQALATPSIVIVSWFAAVVAGQAGFEPIWSIYATAGSPYRWVNAGRVLISAGGGGVIIAALLGNTAMCVVAIAAFLGLDLICAAFFGHRLAWLLPTAYLLVIIGAGAVDDAGAPRVWAAPGNPQPGIGAVSVAAGLLVWGVVVWWRSAGRQAHGVVD